MAFRNEPKVKCISLKNDNNTNRRVLTLCIRLKGRKQDILS